MNKNQLLCGIFIIPRGEISKIYIQYIHTPSQHIFALQTEASNASKTIVRPHKSTLAHNSKHLTLKSRYSALYKMWEIIIWYMLEDRKRQSPVKRAARSISNQENKRQDFNL